MITNVKILGRTARDAEGTLWLLSSASEVSFRLTGASFLSLTLLWNGTCPESTFDRIWPRYAVYLDGRKMLDERLDVPEAEVTVFEGDSPQSHTLRLVKLSECSQSLLGVKAILTDGEVSPLPEGKKRIEFVGDSITCGYGVEGTVEDTFSTATENAEKSHAFLAGAALGADTVLTAYSGCGLVSGYTEGDVNEDNLMIPVYESAGRIPWVLPGGRTPREIPWDFSLFRPDVVVIQLGNNDLSWTRGIPEREEMYRQKYMEFLTVVRRNNPDARILCALGVFGEGLVDVMDRAVLEWRQRTGDGAVGVLHLPAMDEAAYGAGADHHPSERFQRLLADVFVRRLGQWL